jgi:hypothetical protein
MEMRVQDVFLKQVEIVRPHKETDANVPQANICVDVDHND